MFCSLLIIMSVDFGKLENGTSVHIRRSNGRVHKAVVTKFQPDSESITVEWFEDDETKGKEVSLEMIFELNPNLAPDKPKAAAKEKTPSSQLPVRSDREVRHSRRTIAPNSVSSVPSSLRAPPPHHQKENRSPSPDPSSVSVKSNVTKIGGPTSSRQQQQYPPQQSVSKSVDNHDVVGNHHLNNNKYGGGGGGGAGINYNNNYNQPDVMPPPRAPPRGRKSNVVDEVAKLRKNREERRAGQKAERERRNQYYEPGNPNWEFAIMVREFRDQLEMDPLNQDDVVYDHRICVCVRKRPLNKKETTRREIDVATIPSKNLVMISEPKLKVDMTKYLENQKFRFDYAFDEHCDNDMVYWYTARPLVSCMFEGGMATCFAYGQTGSGKTHTMGGDFTSGKNQDARKGIYALAAQDLFAIHGSPQYRHLELDVYASFFEIYSGKVFDLLNKKCRLRVLEDGKQQVQIVGLQERRVSCIDDVISIISEGTKCRTSGVTSANQHSSRSHAVLQFFLRRPGPRKTLHGKFSLIDLAGNERGADTTSSDRQTRVEGAEINKSLLALKECIRAMSQNKSHLPFRASKLTQVLRDSFIGEKSRTCMIATISPGMTSCEHSLNTLRYADRVKELSADDAGDVPKKPHPGLPIVLSPINESAMANQHHQQQQRHHNNNHHHHHDDSDLAALPINANNSDLDLISSLCENEVSHEMMEIHQTVSTLQEVEEEAVECHRMFLQELQSNHAEDLRKHRELFEMTEGIDFDSEKYVQLMEQQLIAQKADFLKIQSEMLEKLKSLKTALQQEEVLSQTIKRNRKT